MKALPKTPTGKRRLDLTDKKKARQNLFENELCRQGFLAQRRGESYHKLDVVRMIRRMRKPITWRIYTECACVDIWQHNSPKRRIHLVSIAETLRLEDHLEALERATVTWPKW